MMWRFFLLINLIGCAAMEQKVDPLSNLNQEPIIKTIIHCAADQSNNAHKFENFNALMKFRRVNKTWKKYCDEEYEYYLHEELETINRRWKEDFDVIKHNPLMGIMFYREFNDMYLNVNMRIVSAIRHNSLVVLHRTWTYPKNNNFLIQKLWLVGENPDHEVENTLYPMTVAVYLDAQPAIHLLQALYKDDEAMKQQATATYEEKKKFDPAMFYLSGGEFRY